MSQNMEWKTQKDETDDREDKSHKISIHKVQCSTNWGPRKQTEKIEESKLLFWKKEENVSKLKEDISYQTEKATEYLLNRMNLKELIFRHILRNKDKRALKQYHQCSEGKGFWTRKYIPSQITIKCEDKQNHFQEQRKRTIIHLALLLTKSSLMKLLANILQQSKGENQERWRCGI